MQQYYDKDDEGQDSPSAAFVRATRVFDAMLARYGFSADLKDVAPMTDKEVEEALYQDYLADGSL